MKLIDVHAHLGRLSPDRREFMDVTNLIAKMDAWGIDKACVLPLSETPEGAYLECDTGDILAACARHPDRLIPFCNIDPRYGNRPDTDFRPLLAEYVVRGCKGLGELIPKLAFDDPRCLNLYRQAGEFGLPVLFDLTNRPHSYGLDDDFGLPKLEHALQACPDTVFIGHGPTFWAEISAEAPPNQRDGYPTGPITPGGAVPRLLGRYLNLLADISAGSGHNALTRDPDFARRFVAEFQDQLLFGTDSCARSDVNSVWRTVALLREWRAGGAIPAPALEKLAWENAVRLLKLEV
jgi:predicted TIM-barrel fold metal-dependent hydrolase